MPKIIGQAEQQQAMRNIKAALKDLTITNQFLETQNPDGIYTVTFKDSEGNHYTTTVYSEEKHVLDSLARAYKKQVVDDAVRQAESNRIEFEPEDRQILGI